MKKLISLIVMLLLIGCQGIGKFEENTTITNQLVIRDEDGTPIKILDYGNLHYINIGDASDKLLADRGLVRVGDKYEEL